MLCRAQQCQWLLSDKVANPHSRSVALNRPTFAQRWQCERFRATPGMVFFSAILCEIEVSLFTTVWCTFCRPHFKNAPNMPVFADFL